MPVNTEKLFQWVPHRPPMVWIDEVVSVGETSECRVELKTSFPYFSGGRIRASSYVEWIAQGYAYSEVCRQLMGAQEVRTLRTAYLVGVKDLRVMPGDPGLSLSVRVKTVRRLDPLVLFFGEVFSERGALLASTTIKVFGR